MTRAPGFPARQASGGHHSARAQGTGRHAGAAAISRVSLQDDEPVEGDGRAARGAADPRRRPCAMRSWTTSSTTRPAAPGSALLYVPRSRRARHRSSTVTLPRTGLRGMTRARPRPVMCAGRVAPLRRRGRADRVRGAGHRRSLPRARVVSVAELDRRWSGSAVVDRFRPRGSSCRRHPGREPGIDGSRTSDSAADDDRATGAVGRADALPVAAIDAPARAGRPTIALEGSVAAAHETRRVIEVGVPLPLTRDLRATDRSGGRDRGGRVVVVDRDRHDPWSWSALVGALDRDVVGRRRRALRDGDGEGGRVGGPAQQARRRERGAPAGRQAGRRTATRARRTSLLRVELHRDRDDAARFARGVGRRRGVEAERPELADARHVEQLLVGGCRDRWRSSSSGCPGTGALP